MPILIRALLSLLLPFPTLRADLDGDGWGRILDCDDGDPATNPGGIEVLYDGVDQNCDGGDLCDADRDGMIWEGAADLEACLGYVPGDDLDCDDTRAGGRCW